MAPRDKTVKLGQIARTCAVFGVDVIQIFPDPNRRGEAGFIRQVLEYLETPQYLRRRLFPLEDSLKFAGLLPPLRIPSHKSKISIESLKSGEVREGVVLEDGATVDIGLDRPLALNQRVASAKRITTRVTSVNPLQGVPTDRSKLVEYWGYTVEERSLEDVLADKRFWLKIATSRKGEPLSACLGKLGEQVNRARSMTLLFGSPSTGLFDMTKTLRSQVGFVVNLYPEQNVVTVRTEEALASALYLLEVLTTPPNTKV